jgi:hypothetical protein
MLVTRDFKTKHMQVHMDRTLHHCVYSLFKEPVLTTIALDASQVPVLLCYTTRGRRSFTVVCFRSLASTRFFVCVRIWSAAAVDLHEHSGPGLVEMTTDGGLLVVWLTSAWAGKSSSCCVCIASGSSCCHHCHTLLSPWGRILAHSSSNTCV